MVDLTQIIGHEDVEKFYRGYYTIDRVKFMAMDIKEQIGDRKKMYVSPDIGSMLQIGDELKYDSSMNDPSNVFAGMFNGDVSVYIDLAPSAGIRFE